MAIAQCWFPHTSHRTADHVPSYRLYSDEIKAHASTGVGLGSHAAQALRANVLHIHPGSALSLLLPSPQSAGGAGAGGHHGRGEWNKSHQQPMKKHHAAIAPKWLVFQELVATSKMFLRSVCSIEFAWVQHLLPRLQQVDAHALSGRGPAPAPSIPEPSQSLDQSSHLASSDASAALAAGDIVTGQVGKQTGDLQAQSSNGAAVTTPASVTQQSIGVPDKAALARQRYLERQRAGANPVASRS